MAAGPSFPVREAGLISQDNFRGGGRGRLYKEERLYILELGLGLISGPVLFFLINQILKLTSIEIQVYNSSIYIIYNVCNFISLPTRGLIV